MHRYQHLGVLNTEYFITQILLTQVFRFHDVLIEHLYMLNILMNKVFQRSLHCSTFYIFEIKSFSVTQPLVSCSRKTARMSKENV